MKKFAMLFVVLCFSLVMAGAAGAALVVDQHQDTFGSGWWLNPDYFSPWGQSFTPTVANLSAVEYGNTGSGGPGITVYVKESISGTIMGTGSIASSVNGWNFIDLDQDVWLTPGNLYILEFDTSYPNGIEAASGNPYANGMFFEEGYFQNNYDLAFRTYYDDTAAVPIPGAAWLLGSGVFGLIGIRRKNS